MEGRRIRVKAAEATTLALTGGYLLMEGDFKYFGKGRRINVYVIPSSARRASYGGPALRSFSEGGLYSPRITDTQLDT